MCWQKNCDTSRAQEKQGFVQLVKGLWAALQQRQLILSIVVSGEKKIIDQAYNMRELIQHVDWITVRAYDYHNYHDGKTGLIAPLVTSDSLSVDVAIKHLIQQGATANKLILGIPAFARTFTLKDEQQHGLNAQITGAGEAGKFTKHPGFWSFYEVCLRIKRDGFDIVRDTTQKGVSAYAFHKNQWVTFDDVETVRVKAKYVKEMQLGGSMISSVDLDDFQGKFGCGKYPLLNTLNHELRGIGRSITKCPQ